MMSKVLHKVLVFACFICLSFLLFEDPALAQIAIGKLSAFKGEVNLEREGRPIPLKLDMSINAKDRIIVKQGAAEIKCEDGSLLAIKQHTDVTLDQGPKKRQIMGVWSKTYLARLINIKSGEVSGVIKERKDLITEFVTPSIVACVKGTTLTTGFDPSTGETTISVDVGVISASAIDGWTIYTLSTGERVGTYVDAKGAVSVHSYAGTISVVAGDATTTVGPGETMTARVNPANGSASVSAVTGTLEVKVGEAIAVLEKGASIEGNVDAAGRATIVATAGNVPVTAAGVTQTLTPGMGTTVTPGNPPTPPSPAAPPSPAPPPPPPPPPALPLPSPST